MEFEFWRLLPIIISTPAQIAFVLIYASRRLGAANWWGNTVGRALFFKSATLAALLSTICCVFIFNWVTGVYTGIQWQWATEPALGVIVCFYWLVAAAVYYQLYALVKNRFFEDE